MRLHHAAAYCTPGSAAEIRPADGFLQNHCPNSRGLTKRFFITWFSTIVDYHFLTENYFSYHVYYHSFLQCSRMLRLEIRKERIIFWTYPSLNYGALALPRQPRNSGATKAKSIGGTRISVGLAMHGQRSSCMDWKSHTHTHSGIGANFLQ